MIEVKPLEIKIKYHGSVPHLDGMQFGDWTDLTTAEDVVMGAGEYKLISLGISMQLPAGYEAHVVPRSSTFKNYGILMANSVGIIDNAYCGNNDIWHFPAYSTHQISIKKGTRIAQMRIVKKQPALEFVEVDDLGNPDRGGFGSTGRR